MKSFHIYESSTTKETQAVKNGFSVPGFFFTWIWAFVKGLIPLGIGLLVIGFAVNLPPQIWFAMNETNATEMSMYDLWYLAPGWVRPLHILSNFVALGMCIYCGLKGNELRGSDLLSKGFKLKETVMAGDPDSALASYIASKKK